jgi:hypothetical protein
MAWIENHPWKMCIIASVVVSFGALIIHSMHYEPVEIGRFFLYLPLVWLMVSLPAIITETLTWYNKRK